MRFVLIFLLLSSLTILVGAQDTLTIQKQRIPDVLISDVDGNPYKTSQMSNEGHPFILVFWKTCCKPPLRELSTLHDIYDDWKEETDVKIYAISVDDARASNTVRPFVDGQGWEFEVLLDPNQLLKRSMNVNALPHTFVLNGQGEVVGQILLFFEGNENDILDMIHQAMLNH